MTGAGAARDAYEAVVVGAGMAGLTAAAYLAREGRSVLLVEMNRECGGLVQTFTRDGFRFDAGVRALLDAGIVFPMLKELGVRLDVVDSPVSLGIGDEILHIDGRESLDRYRDLLVRLFPESEGEVDSVIRTVRKIMGDMDVLYGLENPMFKDLKHDPAFLFKKLLPWLPRFIRTVRKINRLGMPVEDYLEGIAGNPALRDMIAQHFFKKTPAFFALSYFSLYLDYRYPRGGMGKLPEALRGKILEFGGDIRTETRIVDVAADRRLVKDQNGAVTAYDSLIWAADLKTLYRIARVGGLPPAARRRFEAAKDEMLKHRGGDSVFTLFLEVDEPLDTFRNISRGHFFYTPSKRGLGGIHTRELNGLLRDWEAAGKERVLSWLDRFVERNTYEISIPGLKDPDMVPAGRTGLIVSFLAEYDLFDKARKDGWADELKTELENRVLRVLGDSVYPMLKEKVTGRFSSTPLSIEGRIGSSEGAITGWSFQEDVPVTNRIQKAARAVLTPIPSVYQAGQWAYSPAGVPMSILTGKIAANRVLKKKARSPERFRASA